MELINSWDPINFYFKYKFYILNKSSSLKTALNELYVCFFIRYGKGYTLMIKVAVSAAPALPVVDPTPPPAMNLPPAPPPLVFSNPVATESLPEVNEPQKNQRMFVAMRQNQ